MLAFAERYDPQPIHGDEEVATESMYGGLVASGWLTGALSARLLVTGPMNHTASLGGRGTDELRWHGPVRAGDVLSVTVEVVGRRPGDDPSVGHTLAAVTTNDDGEAVLSMDGLRLVEKRESE